MFASKRTCHRILLRCRSDFYLVGQDEPPFLYHSCYGISPWINLKSRKLLINTWIDDFFFVWITTRFYAIYIPSNLTFTIVILLISNLRDYYCEGVWTLLGRRCDGAWPRPAHFIVVVTKFDKKWLPTLEEEARSWEEIGRERRPRTCTIGRIKTSTTWRLFWQVCYETCEVFKRSPSGKIDSSFH